MNTTPDLATKSASRAALLADASAASGAQQEQREKNRRAFQAKCDAMLYIVEFIASFHLRDTRNSGQARKIEELKSLVSQTRSRLGVTQ